MNYSYCSLFEQYELFVQFELFVVANSVNERTANTFVRSSVDPALDAVVRPTELGQL